MGNQTSILQNPEVGDLTFESDFSFLNNFISDERTPILTKSSQVSGSTDDDEQKGKAVLENNFNTMKSNLQMYLTYDNYDSKNNIILHDLKKKSENQDKKLKELTEERDKLKIILDHKKKKGTRFKFKSSLLSKINIVLLLLLIACITLIIYRIITHPYNVFTSDMPLEELIKLSQTDLNSLSNNNLEELNKIIETKIEELNVNNNIKNNNISANNKINNLNKKSKYTLSNIDSSISKTTNNSNIN